MRAAAAAHTLPAVLDFSIQWRTAMNIFKSIPARSVALASLVCILGASPGWAGPRSVTVSFADLNIASEAGADTLLHRIRRAAKQACGEHGPSLVEFADWQACVTGASDDAVRSVHSSLLTALYSGQRRSAVTAMIDK
jgi:UrcA family protein